MLNGRAKAQLNPAPIAVWLFTLHISLKRLTRLALGLLAIHQCFPLKAPGQIHELLNSQQTGAALN
jgi:hypothetical protein